MKSQHSLWLLLAVAILLCVPTKTQAKSFSYEYYDVDIVVNKDTTMDITEKLGYVFDGNFGEVTRGVPLNSVACRGTTGKTCGGYELIAIKEVLDNNGKVLPRDQYSVGIQTNEDTEEKFFVISWKFERQDFDGSKVFPFTIKYKIFGGVRIVGNKYYFYWNTIPSSKGGIVKTSKVGITLPERLINPVDLVIYDNSARFTKQFAENKVNITSSNLPATSDLTVSYPLAAETMTKPAKVNFVGDPYGQEIVIDGISLGTTNLSLDYFPAGNHELQTSFNGYVGQSLDLELDPGEVRTVNLILEPLPLTQIFIAINYLLTLCGCLLTPVLIVLIYMRYRNKGRDKGEITTVVPEFAPPANMHPYLVGSLIDERVDRHDITGSIIDLAYRGHLKITELEENVNYRLTKLAGKDSLNAVEQQLLDALFDGSDEVESKKIPPTFAAKYSKVVESVYAEMVHNGYFDRSPRATIAAYGGCGAAIVGLGIALTICSLVFVLVTIGKTGPFTLGLALIIGGIVMIAAAKFMPAKTESGSKALHKIRGFKMYLETADKHRLEALGPEEFEKYLGYAIALGVSDKWAAKFADIYKQHPDWYESNSTNVWDVFIFNHKLQLFTGRMDNYYYIAGGGSSKGSGWSGSGGSFGGFSGGGGGGGFSGAS